MSSSPMSEEQIPLNPFMDPGGKQSKIFDYCNDAQRKGKSCIWFVRRYWRGVFASDVEIEEIEKGYNEFKLQRFERPWSRFGFYNIVGVRHVQIKFPVSEKGKYGFPTIAKTVRHAEEVAKAYASRDKLEIYGDPAECAPDAEGRRHDEAIECANAAYDDDGNFQGCRLHGRRRAEVSLETFEWTPTLLDHYWEHGIKGAGLIFLDKGGFVVSYKNLATDTFQKAEDPYGKSVDALELVNGWRIRRLLWTTLAAIVIDICIVAIVTLLTGSSETGLAAGSYAAAIEALLRALLTLLSALVQ